MLRINLLTEKTAEQAFRHYLRIIHDIYIYIYIYIYKIKLTGTFHIFMFSIKCIKRGAFTIEPFAID